MPGVRGFFGGRVSMGEVSMGEGINGGEEQQQATGSAKKIKKDIGFHLTFHFV